MQNNDDLTKITFEDLAHRLDLWWVVRPEYCHEAARRLRLIGLASGQEIDMFALEQKNIDSEREAAATYGLVVDCPSSPLTSGCRKHPKQRKCCCRS